MNFVINKSRISVEKKEIIIRIMEEIKEYCCIKPGKAFYLRGLIRRQEM